MKNFGRVIRLALRYRFTFALSLLTALAVGVLWGANIGTVYPFVKVAFQNQSLAEWINRENDLSLDTIRQKTAEIQRLQADWDRAGPEDQRVIGNKID